MARRRNPFSLGDGFGDEPFSGDALASPIEVGPPTAPTGEPTGRAPGTPPPQLPPRPPPVAPPAPAPTGGYNREAVRDLLQGMGKGLNSSEALARAIASNPGIMQGVTQIGGDKIRLPNGEVMDVIGNLRGAAGSQYGTWTGVGATAPGSTGRAGDPGGGFAGGGGFAPGSSRYPAPPRGPGGGEVRRPTFSWEEPLGEGTGYPPPPRGPGGLGAGGYVKPNLRPTESYGGVASEGRGYPPPPRGPGGLGAGDYVKPNLRPVSEEKAPQSLRDTLKGFYEGGGGFNQGIVDRRTENVMDRLNKQRTSRLATNRAALAERGLIGSGPESASMRTLEENLGDQFSTAYSDIVGDESQRADSRMMEALSLATGMEEGEAQRIIDRYRADTERQGVTGGLGLGQGRLDLDRFLGQGQLGLGQGRLDLEGELGRGGLDLQRLLGQGGLANQRYGTDVQRELGLGGLDVSRYGIDVQHLLGEGGLDLQRMLGEGGLALGNLNAMNQYNLGLGQFGLNRDQLQWQMQNMDIEQLMKLIEQMRAGAGQAAGGYV